MTSTIAASGASQTGGDALLGTLGIFTNDRHALSGWLRTFDDAQRAAQVAQRSYWHPNGFAKLVLQACAEHKVRLHVWPAGENRLGESNPHGHRWNFASTVLCGDGLEDTHHVEADSGLPYSRHRYVSDKPGGTLTHVGDVYLRTSTSRQLRIPDRYMINTSVVHTVRPLGTSLIATLVVQGPPQLEWNPVYCAPGVDPNEPAGEITAEDVRELVCSVLAGLDEVLS